LVVGLIVIIVFRLVMCVPRVILALGLTKSMAMVVPYILLQFTVGIAWFKMAKPKEMKDEPTSPDRIVQGKLPSERE